jgi:hypothetical protein
MRRKRIHAPDKLSGLMLERFGPLTVLHQEQAYPPVIARGFGVWEFYHQEPGFPYVSATFNDLAEARKLLINYFIPVWLNHLYVDCLTKEGTMIRDL